jgi:hypothetical protein
MDFPREMGRIGIMQRVPLHSNREVSPLMIFAIAPIEPDSFLPPSVIRNEKREWLFGQTAVPTTKGEVLLVSEDVNLALSLRQYLLTHHIGLNWVSNF